MKKKIALLIILWVVWLLLCGKPKTFEELTPEERLMMDIDATAIF